MKKTLLATTFLSAAVLASAQTPKKPVMEKTDSTVIIRTESICEAEGYNGKTPLVITIKDDVIVKVTAGYNSETPDFFQKVRDRMLPKFIKLKFADYASVDAVSGATFSSKAVTENMKAAYEYYMNNK